MAWKRDAAEERHPVAGSGDGDTPQQKDTSAFSVPPVLPDTDHIGTILALAYDFDCYETCGGSEAVVEACRRCWTLYEETGQWEGSLEDLKCCLFFEQRRYHHYGWGPSDEKARKLRALYQVIRSRWGEV